MSRYNHFSKCKYKEINFYEVAIGDKFRMDKFIGKRRRADIVMIKTGDLTCIEFKSKKEYRYATNSFTVSHYNLKLTP